MTTEIRVEDGPAAGGLVGQAERLQLANRQAGIVNREAERRRQTLATAAALADALAVRQGREGGVLEPRSPVARRRPVAVAAQASPMGSVAVDVWMRDNDGPEDIIEWAPPDPFFFYYPSSQRSYSTNGYLTDSHDYISPYEQVASPSWSLQSDVIPGRMHANGSLTLAPKKSARCGGSALGNITLFNGRFLFLYPVRQLAEARVAIRVDATAYLRLRVNTKANKSRRGRSALGEIVIPIDYGDPVPTLGQAIDKWRTTPLLEVDQTGPYWDPGVRFAINRQSGMAQIVYVAPTLQFSPCAPAMPGRFWIGDEWQPGPGFAATATLLNTLDQDGYSVLTVQLSEGFHQINCNVFIDDWYMPENEISMQWAIAPSLSTLPTLP